jgi:hypothetical protein
MLTREFEVIDRNVSYHVCFETLGKRKFEVVCSWTGTK